MTDNPVAILSSALAAALYRDLPDIEYQDRDWDAWKKLSPKEKADAIKNGTEPTVRRKRKPIEDEVKVRMFPQTWVSTALGYCGMGGAKITTTHTVIIEHYILKFYCVYFGSSRLAYTLNQYDLSARGVENFQNDMRNCKMVSVNEYEARYKI
jgi:hypothetical protein